MRKLLCLVIASILSAGCSGDAPNSKGKAGAGGKLRIAVIPKGTTHDFWKSVHYGALQAAEEFGDVEILWNGTASEKDKEGQIRIVDTYVAEQVDGICLAPIDRDAFVSVVKRAAGNKVPVVIFDSGLSDESDIVSYVATDNYNGGVMGAERLAKKMNYKGGVILLRYQAGSESTEAREDGFLKTLAKYPDIKILSENQRIDSDTTEALRTSTTLLGDHRSGLNGVFTVCEPNNKGMLLALIDEKLAGKVHFVAFDSDPSIIQGMKNKYVDGVVLQDPVRMGYLAVKAMRSHLKGEKVEKRIKTGETLATPENMDQKEIQALLSPKQAD